MILLLIVCFWLVPVLAILAGVGLLAVFFFLGFGWYNVFSEQKMELPGLKFLAQKIKPIAFEEL